MTRGEINYTRLREQGDLVARVRVARERFDVSTEDDRDELLADLLTKTHPTPQGQRS